MEKEPEEINYELLLEVQQVDPITKNDRSLAFACAHNYNLFLTTRFHEHLFKSYGVDPDMTLTEGNVWLNKDGSIKEVKFKSHPYQLRPGFTESPEAQKKLQEAVEKKIRNTIGIEAIRTD